MTLNISRMTTHSATVTPVCSNFAANACETAADDGQVAGVADVSKLAFGGWWFNDHGMLAGLGDEDFW